MAIAPLDWYEDEATACGALPAPWAGPPALRLVPPVTEPEEAASDEGEADAGRWASGAASAGRGPAVRHGADVASRRASRRASRVRRRRLGLAVLVGALLLGAGLPAAALGGRAADPAAALPGAVPDGSGYVYVVHPGDTLRSIALRLDPAHPATEVRLLAGQVGSDAVVPGEHLHLS